MVFWFKPSKYPHYFYKKKGASVALDRKNRPDRNMKFKNLKMRKIFKYEYISLDTVYASKM